MWRHITLVLLLASVLAAPASAGIFFNKKADKPNPAVVVPELIHTLQSDGDEDKRMAAAEQMREFDPAQFPDVVPTLVEALLSDKKPSVRAEAAQSLGKIRPVSDKVGAALEQALAKDSSMRVRLQARSVLLQYRWSGWKEPAPKKDETPTARPKEPAPPQSKEPPLAPSVGKAPPVMRSSSSYATQPASGPRLPPAPTAVRVDPPAPPVRQAEPLPTAPTAPAGDEQGPVLNPPPDNL
jgi:HEAT repeats